MGESVVGGVFSGIFKKSTTWLRYVQTCTTRGTHLGGDFWTNLSSGGLSPEFSKNPHFDCVMWRRVLLGERIGVVTFGHVSHNARRPMFSVRSAAL